MKSIPEFRPSAADCAYAAGFFDGEGTVFIAANKNVRLAKGVIYNMRVMASQVDKTPLAFLRERWGGTHRFTKANTIIKKNGTRGCRECRKIHDKNRGRDAAYWRAYRKKRKRELNGKN